MEGSGEIGEPPGPTSLPDRHVLAVVVCRERSSSQLLSQSCRNLLEEGAGFGVRLWAPANKALQQTAAAATLRGLRLRAAGSKRRSPRASVGGRS